MGSKSNSKSSKSSKQHAAAKSAAAKSETVHEPLTDLSVLRKPVEISATGLQHALKLLETGTAELRHLLMNECDIIYECKVCRSMFRSLTNFISHKRVYCLKEYREVPKMFNSQNHHIEDQTIIVQPEPVAASKSTQSWVTSDVAPSRSSGQDDARIQKMVPKINARPNPKKDLSRIVEKLSQRAESEAVRQISAQKFYDSVSESLMIKKSFHNEYTVNLEPMDNTSFGMYQTVLSTTSQPASAEMMRTQVIQLQNMLARDEATLGPDGKVIINESAMNRDVQIEDSSRTEDIRVESMGTKDHECTICNTRFATRKTLSIHMKSIHVSYRMYYPCPCCKSSFANNWSVYRHLYKVHRKSSEQVRKLRAAIKKKAFKKKVMMASSEKEDGQGSTSNGRPENVSIKSSPKIVLHRLEDITEDWRLNPRFLDDCDMKCRGCGRSFERKSALISHSKMCQKIRERVKVGLFNQSSRAKQVAISQAGHSQYDLMRSKQQNSYKASGDMRQDIPEKKIGIQIRKDYKKDNQNLPKSPQFNERRMSVLSVKSEDEAESGGDKRVHAKQESKKVLAKPVSSLRREHILSPVMEKRMLSLINAQKLQCLPCHKKFQKLANLRRHVAVHIGWNRYQCMKCSYKCFAKYDCVAHVAKVHNEKERAAQMVKYIEKQDGERVPKGKSEQAKKASPKQGCEAGKAAASTKGKDDKAQSKTSPSSLSSAKAKNQKPFAVNTAKPKDSKMAVSPQKNKDAKQDVSLLNVLVSDSTLVRMTRLASKVATVENIRLTRSRMDDLAQHSLTRFRVVQPQQMVRRQSKEEETKVVVKKEVVKDKEGKAMAEDEEKEVLDKETISTADSEGEDMTSKKEQCSETVADPAILPVVVENGSLENHSDASEPKEQIVNTSDHDLPKGDKNLSNDSSRLELNDVVVHIKEEDDLVTNCDEDRPQSMQEEMLRRERPVRNRVKTEKEDFIYDLSVSEKKISPKKPEGRESSNGNGDTVRKNLSSSFTRDVKSMKRKRPESSESTKKPCFALSNGEKEDVPASSMVPKLSQCNAVDRNNGDKLGSPDEVPKVDKSEKPSGAARGGKVNCSPSETSKAEAETLLSGYNISTRKSLRVLDSHVPKHESNSVDGESASKQVARDKAKEPSLVNSVKNEEKQAVKGK